MRPSDVFTDRTYLAFRLDVSWFERLSFFAASPANRVLHL